MIFGIVTDWFIYTQVVLPVVARQKGMDEYYQTADGSPQAKKVDTTPAPVSSRHLFRLLSMLTFYYKGTRDIRLRRVQVPSERGQRPHRDGRIRPTTTRDIPAPAKHRRARTTEQPHQQHGRIQTIRRALFQCTRRDAVTRSTYTFAYAVCRVCAKGTNAC